MPYTKTIYEFSELTEQQQKAYFELYPEKFTPYQEWYECTIENKKEILESLGFTNVNIGFSGFWSQGDGAHFTGEFYLCPESIPDIEKVLREYTQYEELQTFAKCLLSLCKQDNHNSPKVTIHHRGHYQHELCTYFEFSDCIQDELEQTVIGCCRYFMQEIYQSLEQEYEYLNSWEYVKEAPECWDFIEIEESELDLL